MANKFTAKNLINSISSTTNIEPNLGTIIWAVINSVLFVYIIAGNILVLIAVRKCRRLRSMIPNLFIFSLALSDFIVGLMLPYHSAFYMGLSLSQSYGLCLMRFFFIIFACCVSILTLISIALDRYIAIVYALHYNRYVTRRSALFLIAFNWLFGASVAVIPIFWNHWTGTGQCEFDEVLPMWYILGVITPGYIFIWLVMVLVYWRIVREAAKHTAKLDHTCNNRLLKRFRSDVKSIHIVIIVMGCFSLCWLPYFMVACTKVLMEYKATFIYKGAFSLAMSNSGINPIVYCWKNTTFRKAFACLLHCKDPNTNEHFSHFQIENGERSRQPSLPCPSLELDNTRSRRDAVHMASIDSRLQPQGQQIDRICKDPMPEPNISNISSGVYYLA